MSAQIIANRKIRGAMARRYIQDALRNKSHPMYTASDVELAKELNVSRLTVLNIRRELGLKGRNRRIVELLKGIDTTKFTLKELSEKLCLKYPNTYKLVRKIGLKTRPDRRPIDAMIEYRRKRSADSNATL